MIYSLELKIVQDGIAVRKLPSVILAEISNFFLLLLLFLHLSVYNVVISMHRVLSRLSTMCVYICIHIYIYVVEMSGHFERVDN